MSYYVYIMSSKSGVLYIGATNDLDRRVFEHQQGLIEGFTKKYQVTRLIYVERFEQNPAMVDYARRTARDPSRRQPTLRMTQGAKGRSPTDAEPALSPSAALRTSSAEGLRMTANAFLVSF